MSDLNNADCEKGHVSQQPLISYAPSKDETAMKASRETIKMKTSEGEVKVAVLGDSPGAEKYLQHINNFIRMLERKKIEEDLLKLAKAVISPKALVRKLKMVPQGERPTENTAWLLQLEAATKKLVEAEVCEDAKVVTIYDLFRKTLKEDPELQWDRIVKDMHSKDPWEDLRALNTAESAGDRANPYGNASISISAQYILSMQRSSRGCTYYVTSRSLQRPVSEHT